MLLTDQKLLTPFLSKNTVVVVFVILVSLLQFFGYVILKKLEDFLASPKVFEQYFEERGQDGSSLVKGSTSEELTQCKQRCH